jgi:hypothetical protein
MAKGPVKAFNDDLDAAIAPAMRRATTKLLAARIMQAAKEGGQEAAKAVAREMTPEQAAQVADRIRR